MFTHFSKLAFPCQLCLSRYMSAFTDLSSISSFLVGLIRKTGQIALSYQADCAANPERKPDGSPVTDADREVERAITNALNARFPDIPVLGEETIHIMGKNYPQNRFFFLVDPIDGTRAYVDGRKDFTVNIALIESDKPLFGVIGAPGLGRIYYGGVGFGAFRCDQSGAEISIKTASHSDGQIVRMIASRYYARMDDFSTILTLPKHQIQVDSLSSSLKFCRIAEGEADFYPRFGRTCFWDTAAGQAIIEAAGGLVLRASDKKTPLSYTLPQQIMGKGHGLYNPEFLVAANRDIIKYVV